MNFDSDGRFRKGDLNFNFSIASMKLNYAAIFSFLFSFSHLHKPFDYEAENH